MKCRISGLNRHMTFGVVSGHMLIYTAEHLDLHKEEIVVSKAHFILYVADQEFSMRFYSHVLDQTPVLCVPGMTEFELSGGAILGLMPVVNIRNLLGHLLPDPSQASGVPRAELYLLVSDAQAHHQRALTCGAIELSSYERRDWGDYVSYCLDPESHVLAFADQGDKLLSIQE